MRRDKNCDVSDYYVGRVQLKHNVTVWRPSICLWNDLFCVGWDVKTQLSQSTCKEAK